MTNGEKIIEIFPNINIYEHGSTYSINNEYNFNASWWNAEYQEPTTKNNLAQERYQDLIDYFGDKEVAKTILEDRKEFKAWLERLRWNVKRVDELARELEQLKGTAKDDLGVDCISRQEVLNLFNKSDEYSWEMSLFKRNIEEMPSVTPQLSSGLEKNSKKLEKDFGELDCISRQGAIDAIRRIHPIDTDYDCTLFDKVDVMYVLNDMPSVTPIRPKGHWVYTPQQRLVKETDDGGIYITDYRCSCSECGGDFGFIKNKDAFCKFCGADMREEEE